MTLNDLLEYLRSLAPEESAMDGDPIGLLIGSCDKSIRKVAVCLDATMPHIAVAAEHGVDIIVAHHPLIYRPLRRLNTGSPIEDCVVKLVTHEIALYAYHTNWDFADQGINATLATTLGVANNAPLQPDGDARMARFGRLTYPLDAELFLESVAAKLGCKGTSALRHNLNEIELRPRVVNLAVCGGAGAEFAPAALAAGADVFVTSDVRHHEFVDASARGLFLVDAGHHATENPGMKHLSELIAVQFPALEVRFLS